MGRLCPTTSVDPDSVGLYDNGMLPPEEIGCRVRQVREETRLAPGEVAERSGIPLPEYEQLEAGQLSPLPGDYVLLVADALDKDFKFFISTDLDEEEEQTREIYRALGEPTTEDRLSIRRFLRFSTVERDLELLLGVKHSDLPVPRAPSRGRHIDQGEAAAGQERQRLGLGNAPIANVFDVLRGQGIRLFRFKLADSEVSGLTIVHPAAGACVLVNYDDDLYRQFFSAAHEYAHVLFDRQQVELEGCIVSRYRKSDLVEMRANRFASEFLIPRSAFDRYPKPSDLDGLKVTIEKVARDYKVNTLVVAIAMERVGWISQRTVASFRDMRPVTIHQRDKRDPDIPQGLTEAQIERRQEVARHGVSGYFLDLLRRAVIEDQITFARFAEILNMSITEARSFVDEVKLGL